MIDWFGELCHRLDMTKEWNTIICGYWLKLTGGALPWGEDDKLLYEEIVDRILKTTFGAEHNLGWFKENGFVSWPKKVEEAYWRPFINARSSIYNEWLISQGKKTREICEPRGVSVDYEHFTPLLTYFPTVTNQVIGAQNDLIAFSYRDILHTGTATGGDPWITEASNMNPFTYKITMNVKTAKSKGLKEGDIICVENHLGDTIKGVLHTIEGQHPQTVAVTPAGGGRWVKGQPLARNKGVCFNNLLPAHWGWNCPVTLNIETTAPAKVYKA